MFNRDEKKQREMCQAPQTSVEKKIESTQESVNKALHPIKFFLDKIEDKMEEGKNSGICKQPDLLHYFNPFNK